MDVRDRTHNRIEAEMNAKQPIPVPAILAIIAVVVAVAAFFGFRTLSGPAREAPSSVQMYDRVKDLAQKSGGDYSKLSADDQKYLEVMSHGHGQKLLESQFARLNSSPRGN